MEQCPCDSGKEYKDCCKPVLSGESPAQTAEALMRSRYTAFAKGEVDYIFNSLHPDKREQHDETRSPKEQRGPPHILSGQPGVHSPNII